MTKTMTPGFTPAFTAGMLPGFAILTGRISAFVGAVAAARKSRLALASLSDQMLADAGVDPSLARPNARYEVSARTMTGLMSMR
ncbi:MAG TPA: hypothetical protein PKA13_04350 [Geminicoccaceae bacterium]|nr:hypothetical protein [Geminicoccus sp.]HMU48980.1 hypothetical protein [Geminicoccaceae bacterium]